MRTTPIVVIAVLATFSAHARAEESATKPDPKAVFAETDTNGDGRIDREEFHERIVDVFYKADTNKDGVLSPDELKQLPFSEAFSAADTDASGNVTLREFLRIRNRQFDEADTDHDGELSLEEVITVYEGRKSK